MCPYGHYHFKNKVIVFKMCILIYIHSVFLNDFLLYLLVKMIVLTKRFFMLFFRCLEMSFFLSWYHKNKQRYNIKWLIGSRYASKDTDGIIVTSPISQVSIWRREGVLFMLEILVHITTTVISGCIIALFTHWLRNRKDK